MTKQDMLDFYRTSFLPGSSKRMKTSTHLIAQASADSIAEKQDPRELRGKLADALAKTLTAIGVDTDVDALTKRLEKIDITSGDKESMTGAIAKYLEEDAKLAKDAVEQVREQGEGLLAQLLPSLGIRSAPAAAKANGQADGVDGDANGEVNGEKKSEVILIEDVPGFKASLALSAAPRPVRDLSEFEELEPKL